MKNEPIEKLQLLARRSLRTTSAFLAICLAVLANTAKHNNIRSVDILTFTACGIGIGAFIVTLINMLRIKRSVL